MLSNEEVVTAVCKHLVATGHVVTERDVGQSPNIVALKNGARLLVETRGGLKPSGKPFTPKQVREHIGQKLYSALKLNDGKRSNDAVGIALPNDQGHASCVDPIRNSVRYLGIRIYWVARDGTVTDG